MAPLTRSSLFGVLVGGAYASDTCAASGTCAEDTTLLQLHGLKNALRHGVKAKTSNWPQHEVDASKCNLNVDMVYVADQDACEALAVANGHPYYSFRHNAESDGHKCMSSETCGDDLIGDRTNEWKIYYQNFWPQHEVDQSKCNNNVDMVYVANQLACQDLAVANGHSFYSFRHNGEDAGHKCMSSAECSDDALIGDRTNEWKIYSAPIENQCLGTYEAESATLEGAVVATNHDGFTGDGFVDYINPNGDYIEWSVSSCGGGSATASFRYALSGGDRPLQVLVNGVEVAAALSFPATGSWSSWGEASVAVELNAGSNVVKLVVTGTSGANTDSLIIS